jgi:hypothetical protein
VNGRLAENRFAFGAPEHLLGVHARAAEPLAGHELAAEHPDRARECAVAGHDQVRGGREVEATRRRHVRERRHHGLLPAELVDRSPDHVGRERAAARAVDVEHHGAHPIVLREPLEDRGHGVGGDRGARSLALEHHRTLEVQDRHGRGAGAPRRHLLEHEVAEGPPAEGVELRARAVALLQPVEELILVHEVIDEARVPRVRGGQRGAIEQRTHLVERLLSALGDAGEQLLVEVGDQIPDGFLVRGRRERPGPGLAERLVGSGGLEIGANPEPRQRRPEKRELDPDPDETHVGRGQEEHPIAAAEIHVAAFPAVSRNA